MLFADVVSPQRVISLDGNFPLCPYSDPVTDDPMMLGVLVGADDWIEGTIRSIRASRGDGCYESCEEIARRVLRAVPEGMTSEQRTESLALLLASALLRLA